MRTTAVAVVFGLALTSAVFGANAAPSQQALSEMGFNGMQILSDEEAANVRGFGFSGIDLHKFKAEIYHEVKDIKHDIRGAQKEVKRNINKVERIFHSKPHGGGGNKW